MSASPREHVDERGMHPMRALVTGGAGFIGSHLVDALLARGCEVRVLDDLSNGLEANVDTRAELVRGDIAEPEVVRAVMEGVDVVFHQAALGSVKRSLESPFATDRVNAHGSLVILELARLAGIKRVVAASSSSVYGGAAPLPSVESSPPLPRSPYAVSKLAAEHYCRVYADLYGLDTVCLRYFNVYGPRQRSDSAYAAAIPLFIDALRGGDRPMVHGDGGQSRDFTYVGDVVAANLLALEAPAERCRGRVFNIAGGRQATILELLSTLGRIFSVAPDPVHTDPRPGDVRHSSADISAARSVLGYEPAVDLDEGLRRTVSSLA